MGVSVDRSYFKVRCHLLCEQLALCMTRVLTADYKIGGYWWGREKSCCVLRVGFRWWRQQVICCFEVGLMGLRVACCMRWGMGDGAGLAVFGVLWWMKMG